MDYAGTAKDKISETASSMWDSTKDKAYHAKEYAKGAYDESKK